MNIAEQVRRVKQSIEADCAQEIENNRMALDRAAKRISLADLSVDDLAVVIGDVIKNQRREILKHVQRMLTLAEVKQRDPHEKTRLDRIARRISQIESELRMARKNRGG
jgi:hypothetical protein